MSLNCCRIYDSKISKEMWSAMIHSCVFWPMPVMSKISGNFRCLIQRGFLFCFSWVFFLFFLFFCVWDDLDGVKCTIKDIDDISDSLMSGRMQ